MFFAPFEDLTFLEATQDGHDVHRLFVVGLAGGVDALLSDPNHRLLRRDFSGSDRSGSDFNYGRGGSLISFTISLSSRPLHTDMQPVQAATFFLNQPGSCLVEKVAQT